MLRWFLRHYGRVLFVDDDVLISPFAPDLFAQVACHKVGAVIESYHAQGWHAMHSDTCCRPEVETEMDRQTADRIMFALSLLGPA